MSALSQALREGLAALEQDAGETFSSGDVSFVAWPAAAPAVSPTQLTATPEVRFHFETRAVVELKGESFVLSSTGKKHTVVFIGKRNPVTGILLFAVGEGRAP